MPFFARFRIHEGHQFRLDTRIYLRDGDKPGDSDTCVAAIIGKNPGSANPRRYDQLAELSLDGDKLLPCVRNRFVAAYAMAGLAIPQGAFIRVWNLVYLCNPRLSAAIAALGTIRRPLVCATEDTSPRIVWYAWGPPNAKLIHFTSRFIARRAVRPFYFEIDSKAVVAAKPQPHSKVRHTQGMSARPIEKHLAQQIGKRGGQAKRATRAL